MHERPEEPPDWYNVVARQKTGISEWRWCRLEALGDPRKGPGDILVEGGVPTTVFKRGPRKGDFNWKDVPLTRMCITQAELTAVHMAYEAATGKCYNCAGSGEEVWGFNRVEGPKRRTCRRCKGSGQPPASTTSPSPVQMLPET